MYQITVDLPNLPEGKSVAIDGLGVFKNGTTSQVTDQQLLRFNALHVRQVSIPVPGKKGRFVVRTVPGRTLEEWAQSAHGITVTSSTPPVEKGDDK